MELAYQLFKSLEVVAAIIAAAALVTTKQYVGNRCGAETQYKNFKKEKGKITSKKLLKRQRCLEHATLSAHFSAFKNKR